MCSAGKLHRQLTSGATEPFERKEYRKGALEAFEGSREREEGDTEGYDPDAFEQFECLSALTSAELATFESMVWLPGLMRNAQ